MAGLPWAIVAALRAVLWRSTPLTGEVSPATAVACALIYVAAIVAGQHIEAEAPASFSPYGFNSAVATSAVFAAAVLLLMPKARAAALSAILLFAALVELLVVLLGVAASYLPQPNFAPGLWTKTDGEIMRLLLLAAWAICGVAAILRGAGVSRRGASFGRSTAVVAVSFAAMLALPYYPMFIGRDFNYRTANVWELVLAYFEQRQPDQSEPLVSRADLDLRQPALMETQIRSLAAERPGKTDLYVVGIAGWSEQDVFIKELDGAITSLDGALETDRGSIRLVNNLATMERLPSASHANFAAAIQATAHAMNKEEDVLVLFMTSHGSQRGVALKLADAIGAHLTPDQVAATLDEAGIKNRLVIVSACHSGVFVEPLKSPDSIVLTASDADRTSFGCSNEREWTYFGDAFFNQSLKAGIAIDDAFEDAKKIIAQWEMRDGLTNSNPQAHYGAALMEKLKGRGEAKAGR